MRLILLVSAFLERDFVLNGVLDFAFGFDVRFFLGARTNERL